MASSDSGNKGMRGGRGFRRASETAREPLRAAAGRYGFAETDVLVRWPEVLGEALAGLCRPLKVSYGRARGLGATLTVEVEGARAPEVEMQAPRIVERINSFYGYRAITRLRITQASGYAGPPSARAGERAGDPAPEPAPDPAAAGRAGELAGRAQNPELRAALTRLGTYVLAQPRGPRA